MSARKASHGTIFLIVSSGSPLALIASSRRSTSKKPFCPMTRSLHPPATAGGQRVRFATTWRDEFFGVPISLRRCQKELRSRALDRRRRNIPASNSVGAHALEQNLNIGAHIAPWAHFTITLRRGSGETVADVPLTPGTIHNLALMR